MDEIMAAIKEQTSPMLITIKGERGLILASVPLQDPSEEFEFAQKILEKLSWKIVTLRVLYP
ncbi:hypothetical protein, partial [Vibrio parahaemolyticus]|uniref:hypothetical protein n=1 Tax=Vibrio parahaemolyticus TaxID=670 RepID=UPI0021117C63